MLMKKMMMMAVMVAGATSAFAQDALVKEAKALLAKGDFDQAIEKVTPALTSAETTDKAAAWNLLSDIHYQKFSKIQQTEMENKVKKVEAPYDTVGLNKSIAASLEAALKADEFDRQPNAKGKVKIRFRKANQDRWTNGRLNLINAGLFAYNHKNLDEAFKDWALYLDCPEQPMFEGVDLSKDQYRSEIAYYAGLVAYQKKDYANAEKYAKIAAQDPAKAADANEIMLFSAKENCKTKEDSVAYVTTLKELRASHPDEDKYFNLLIEYYNFPGRTAEQAEWIDSEVAAHPQYKMAWAIKGESLMNAQKWDEAVEAYKKALELDPSFVPCVFNAGVCLNSKAIDLKDQLADKRTGGLTVENANKVKAILKDSQVYLEKARELDPYQEKVKWAYPLYQIYYALGDAEKTAEMEKLLNR